MTLRTLRVKIPLGIPSMNLREPIGNLMNDEE